MELDEIVSIVEEGEAETYDIHHTGDKSFFIDEPNFICQDFLVHNSGIIISDVDIDARIPVVKTSKGDYVAGLQESGSCTDILQAGFIKFDILGVNNLDIVKEVMEHLPKDEKIDVFNLPENDTKVFDVLKKDTEGLFQISSNLAKKLIDMTNPSNQQELSDLIALGRPGTLSVGSDKEYADNKKAPPAEIPEFIKSALKSSHYVLLYQEQVMKIFMNLGFSEKEADDIRGLLKKIQKMKLGKVTDEEKKKLKELGLLD
jgi:DNA polymerase-3 subunit alpha